ncbi:hypothetical protein LTR86_010517 [Recurvomyces mirabilis]|nr:hypothetical protein LTR86_010517 [Recurvomyces mirabilis]
MPVDDLNSLIDDACVIETLLWDPADHADALSRVWYDRPLAATIWTQRQVSVFWSRVEPLPKQDHGVFGEQTFQHLCAQVAAQYPVDTVSAADFQIYPNGWSIPASFKNDKGPSGHPLAMLVVGSESTFGLSAR